ncbi:MAG: hypothetical protein Q4G46_04975 [Propionibacteriaceae bacterium]|nr:hypothetical protein [Propionibacteriaceae bacterium]
MLIVGVVSLFASVVAAGLDYRKWEAEGGWAYSTPSWILAWHAVSLAVIVAGVVLFLVALLLRRNRSTGS